MHVSLCLRRYLLFVDVLCAEFWMRMSMYVWHSSVVKSTFLSLLYPSLLVNVKSAINASHCATSDYTLHRSQTGKTRLSAIFLIPPFSLPHSLSPALSFLILLFFLIILLLILLLILLSFLLISRAGPTLSGGHTCIGLYITTQSKFCLPCFHHQH